MKITETGFKGLVVVSPKVFDDSRGYFFESYNKRAFDESGLEIDFVQDNQSSSSFGVLRGLHFQKPPHAQTKLVRVLSGAIQDVVVDIRRDQPTFGKYFSIELSAENKKQLLVPPGFAHGFAVLTPRAEVLYKCDSFYQPSAEGGIRHDDSALAIPWQIEPSKRIVSQKDLMLPEFASSFTFQN
ncbi:MAG TPA: dTDP-4-dehydrorhamnose 3,5-epimerase [Cyclobacteriaceae bacterium]|nr:dTDP-4-dehydrorhamnose 3,5-epimerase [Cyclobacteriaceae bacterium]